jgi:hypothetical protein
MANLPEVTFEYAKDKFGFTDKNFIKAKKNAEPGEFIYEDN